MLFLFHPLESATLFWSWVEKMAVIQCLGEGIVDCASVLMKENALLYKLQNVVDTTFVMGLFYSFEIMQEQFINKVKEKTYN